MRRIISSSTIVRPLLLVLIALSPAFSFADQRLTVFVMSQTNSTYKADSNSESWEQFVFAASEGLRKYNSSREFFEFHGGECQLRRCSRHKMMGLTEQLILKDAKQRDPKTPENWDLIRRDPKKYLGALQVVKNLSLSNDPVIPVVYVGDIRFKAFSFLKSSEVKSLDWDFSLANSEKARQTLRQETDLQIALTHLLTSAADLNAGKNESAAFAFKRVRDFFASDVARATAFQNRDAVILIKRLIGAVNSNLPSKSKID